MDPERLWHNHDILCEIFEHLSLSDDWDAEPPDLNSLASCARVCRAFLDPALDGVWRELRCIDYLLAVFSAFRKDQRGTYRLDGDVTAEEWSRYHYYARRVRILWYDCEHSLSTLLADLASHAGDVQLFPSLKIIRIGSIDHLDSSLQYLLSPTVRSVFIDDLETSHAHHQEDIRGTFLYHLFHKSPLLEELDLTHPSLPYPMASFRDITLCNYLVQLTVDVPSVDLDTLRAISKLESLLDFSISCRILGDSIPACSGFSNLHHLQVHGKLPNIKAILACISPPHLQKLFVSHIATYRMREDFASRYTDVVEVLSSKHRALRDITFRGISPAPSSVDEKSALNIFRPLLQLHDLQNINLNFDYRTLGLSDEDLHSIASAWPRLTSFSLSYGKSTAVPSFDALDHLARCCPELTKLRLPSLDLRSFPRLEGIRSTSN
ncbi:hypothetical protein BKA93DRAFT_337652 [Sparassis latifolia]